MWTILILLHPDGATMVPIRAYPTYIECGQAIPAMAAAYFPHGMGDWVVACEETATMATSPVPKMRGD